MYMPRYGRDMVIIKAILLYDSYISDMVCYAVLIAALCVWDHLKIWPLKFGNIVMYGYRVCYITLNRYENEDI